MLAGASYNYFVYEHALSHMRVIFVAAGLLYFFGFGMMCWRVKEGEYPPPVARPARDRGLLGMVRTYARECLRQRMHILLYLHVMLWALATSVLTFSVFLNLSLGITLKQLGTLSAISGVATAVLAYPAGMLADRFHPVRLMIWMKFGLVILAPLSFVWLFTHFSPSVNFAILVGLYVVAMPLNLMYGAILMPLYNRLFPREQFGQFTSFMGICSAAAMVCGGVVVGLFLDGMRVVFPDALYGKDFCYRLIPAWSLFFLSLSLILLALLYKEWRRKGGEAYEPHPVVVKADATKEIS
jgi:MFS family permease